MDEYEVNLADYLVVLWRKKWVVVLTFLLAVGGALAWSMLQPVQYQADTALLILPPLAADIADEVPGTVYSPETYKRFALAQDLLQTVIRRAYPEGTDLTVNGLQRAMTVELDDRAAQDFPGRFPLYIRTSFTGRDEEALPRLAEAWAEAFVEKNAELFVSRIAQSYDYISESFSEVEGDLRAKQTELRRIEEENQPHLLRAELEAMEEVYAEYVRELSAQRRALSQAETRLAVYEAFLEEPARYALASGMLSSAYSGYVRDLAQKERELTQAEGRLASLERALAEEPEFYALKRGVSSDALWQYIGARSGTPNPAELERFAGLSLEDQELNLTYVELRRDVASTRALMEALEAEIAHLKPQSEALWGLVNTRPDLVTGAGEQDAAVVSEVLQRAEYDLRGEIAAARADAEELRADLASLEAQADEGKQGIEARRSRLIAAEAEIQRLEREIQVLERSYERMADKLQDARAARAETAEPIRVVEAALPETVRSITPPRAMNVSVAGVLGLFVGVMLAFVVHALQEHQAEQRAAEGKPPQREAPPEEG